MTNDGNFTQGIGRIAVDLFDFRRHVDGYGFNHRAIDITTSPGVDGATNVQTSINNINDFIASLAGKGTAFIAIPDGYNCYTNPAPNFYFSNSIPPLSDFLNPLFTAISTGSTMPAGYERLKNGGILYIPAGTYYIEDTVSIPPSIVLFGEGYATKLINATSLNLALSPPMVDSFATQVPMFIVKADLNRSNNDSAVDAENQFMFSRSTKFINITIGDNFIEPTLLGDVYYKLPQNTLGDVPLIMQEQGSHLEISECKMLGRALTTSEVLTPDEATRFAVKLDTTTPSSGGTILKITNSFIDGFSLPISFSSAGGTNDYLEVSGSKMRSHGYIDDDGVNPSNNCCISMNDNNAIITSNYFYGNHPACTTVVYIDDVVAAPVLQATSKILIAGNDFAIDKADSSTLTATFLSLNVSIATSILSTASIILYGNNFQGNSFTVEDSSGTLFSAGHTTTYLPVGVKHKTATITTTTYTIDSSSADYMLFVNTTNNPVSITLPPHEVGRKIVIQDISYNALDNNITLVRNAGTGNIGDYNGDRAIASNGASWTLISNGSSWILT